MNYVFNLAYPAMDHVQEFRAKYPIEVSDRAEELSKADDGGNFLMSGEARRNRRENRNNDAYRHLDFQNLLSIDDDSSDEDYQDYHDYRFMILNRNRADAPRQLRLVFISVNLKFN